MEEVTEGQINCQLPSGLPPGLEGNWCIRGVENWGKSDLLCLRSF